MSIFKQFSTDTKKEADGVKLEFAPNDDGSVPSVTIRRAGKSNKRYAKALEAETRKYRRQMELGTMDNEVSEKILQKVYAETIITGWENIQQEDGRSIPFTKDAAILLFEKLPEFYEEIQKQANTVSLFRNESMEDEAKN